MAQLHSHSLFTGVLEKERLGVEKRSRDSQQPGFRNQQRAMDSINCFTDSIRSLAFSWSLQVALRHPQFSGASYTSIAGPPLGECELLQMAYKHIQKVGSTLWYWE